MKRKSKGTILLGVAVIILGLVYAYFPVRDIAIGNFRGYLKFLASLPGLLIILTGIGILLHHNWSRVLVVWLSLSNMFSLALIVLMAIWAGSESWSKNYVAPIFMALLLFNAMLVYYFTRPNVKKEFN